jgi:hypothetical protein
VVKELLKGAEIEKFNLEIHETHMEETVIGIGLTIEITIKKDIDEVITGNIDFA